MATDACWTRIVVDDHRDFVYGALTGRLYLLKRADAADPRLHAVLGLGRMTFDGNLEDPAGSVAHDSASLSGTAAPPSPRAWRAAYRLVDRTRSVMPFAMAARLAAAAAARKRSRGAPAEHRSGSERVDAIARAIHVLERDVGYADCYPRALLTAYVALAAGIACRLAIGVLAPTRKMHAWCSIDGVVPYEPMREHFLYRPLLVMALTA